MNNQFEIVESYRTAHGVLDAAGKPRTIPRVSLWRWDGVILAMGAQAFFVATLFLWRSRSLSDGAQTIKPSLTTTSQFAITYSAVHQTNHGREAHTFLIKATGDVWQMECPKGDLVTFKPVDVEGKTPDVSLGKGTATK